MTAPTAYLRQLREGAARRRLELSRLLRDNPAATNKELAKTLGVNRDTIALDRKVIMEELQKSTLTETEQLRSEMVTKLEDLNNELERHRRDGKLPIGVVHEMLLVHRTLIEVLGVRKPVVERMDVNHRQPIVFQTTIVSTDGGKKVERKQGAFEVKKPLTLEANNEQR
jgi:hypothetical protein